MLETLASALNVGFVIDLQRQTLPMDRRGGSENPGASVP